MAHIGRASLPDRTAGQAGMPVLRAALLVLVGALPVHAQEEAPMSRPEARIWIESSMVRVMPGDAPRAVADRPVVRVSLARGERESFQVLIRPAKGHPLQNVRLAVAPLTCRATGAALAADHITWHQVGYVRVVDAPDKGPAPVRWLEPGWYPDPLLPVRRFSVTEEFTQSVWVTVYAPDDAPAGTYTGSLLVQADGQPNRRIALRARVYDFAIPPGAGHLRTAFSLMDGEIRALYNNDEAMVRRYRDYVLDELRLNPWNIWADAPPPLEELERLRGHGYNLVPLCYLRDDRKASEWPWAPSPQGAAEQLQALAPTFRQLQAKGLLPLGYVFGGDEVPREPAERIAQVKAAFARVKAICPDIPLMTTAHIPQDVESLRSYHLDALCPMWDWSEFERAEGLRRAGLAIWSYISLQPYPPFPNWRLDNDLIEARTIFWQVYHQMFDAFLYWGLNIWDRPAQKGLVDPEAGPFVKWTITTEPGGHDLGWLHGDGRLLYPGKDGPIGSIRLANIRDGLEDYEYLWLLAQRTGDRETARAACRPVGWDLDKATRNPRTLYRQREAIARRLEGRGR
jgi:hypothetical protein